MPGLLPLELAVPVLAALCGVLFALLKQPVSMRPVKLFVANEGRQRGAIQVAAFRKQSANPALYRNRFDAARFTLFPNRQPVSNKRNRIGLPRGVRGMSLMPCSRPSIVQRNIIGGQQQLKALHALFL